MKEKTFIGASIAAAVVASFCCILPIVFAVTGITVLGAAAAFAGWRPYLLGVTFGLLAVGFYFAYRPSRNEPECGPGSACVVPATKRSGRLLLWIATAAVIALAAFPYYSGPVADLVLGRASTTAAAATATTKLTHRTLAIEGMDCAGCAKAIENKLTALPGVRQARVSYERGVAEIDYNPRSVSVEQLDQAIREAGYRVAAEPRKEGK